MTNYTTPVLLKAIFHSILACQKNSLQVTAAGAREQREILSPLAIFKENSL